MKDLTTNPDSTEMVPADDPNEALWELNHAKITSAIANHIAEHGSMPANSLVAEATGLNRNTIAKHMSAYREGLLKKEREGLGLMTNHILARVMKEAMQGDLTAAKLFLDRLDPVEKKTPVKEPVQHNYVQINKTVINQQVIQQLTPDALMQIEQIIANNLNQPARDAETEPG